MSSAAWSGLEVGERIGGGNRNQVWAGTLGERRVVVRRSRRSPESLKWELELLVRLGREGFGVPVPIATDARKLSHECVVVQPWIDGREPSSPGDWELVVAELRRLHEVGAEVAQRPGCSVVTAFGRNARSVDADLAAMPDGAVDAVLAAFAAVGDAPVSLIHGDPGRSNIRVDGEGRVWFLDWDESRVDVTWHDLSNLGVQVLDPADHARAERLSHAWEAANAWTAEPAYARQRLAALRDLPGSA